MLAESRVSFVGFGVGASLATHLAIVLWLSSVPRESELFAQPALVDFVVAPSPPPSESEPLEEPEPEAPIEAPKKVAAAAPQEPPPEPEATPPPVADLTGLTLTNTSGGSGWSSAVGDGTALEHPIRSGVILPDKPAPRPVAKPPAPRPVEPASPAVVAVSDLSSKPVPPELSGQLAQHYPSAARELGQAGIARVRLRIDADGVVRSVNVLSESDSGFGAACKKTVLGSRWSPPKDHEGRSVATQVRYICRFQVH